MSSACVGVHLGDEEYRGRLALEGYVGLSFGLQGHPLYSQLSWRRYVDDVLSASRRLCSECQGVIIKTVYAENLLMCYLSPRILHEENWDVWEWLDLSMGICGSKLFWFPRNANRPWLWNPTSPNDRPKPIPSAWPGTLAMPTCLGSSALTFWHFSILYFSSGSSSLIFAITSRCCAFCSLILLNCSYF